MLPHARVLLHPPSTSSGRGALPDLEIQAKEIQRVRDEVDEILASHTGQDPAVLRADTSRDRIFTAQQAVAYGLVDEVVASRKVRVAVR
jgi:ATP-dependent Clp protease protease subunit